MGTDFLLLIIDILRSIRCHPSPVFFAFSREEICIENRDKTSLLISYFISSYIFMIDFNVENLFEIEPIQFICYAKSSI